VDKFRGGLWGKVENNGTLALNFYAMKRFLGEFECRLDNKGRFILPAALKKQLPENFDNQFVVNRGFQKYLTMYISTEWETITDEINKLNPYVKENLEFIRYFHRGATELTMDSAARLLLPKRLLEYAGIENDIILFAYSNRIEIWSLDAYNNSLSQEPDEFASLAEKVMGGKNDAANGN
jgi:MraZ protein